MSDLIRAEIQALKAYHVPDARGMIKLDAMENPYPLPDDVKQAWLAQLADVELNRYPDPAASELSSLMKQTMDVPANAEIILGNGSDELIQILALAVATPGRCILSVSPSFVMYSMIARFTGMAYIEVPLTQDFSLDVEAVLAAIEQHDPALIFLAYPNNPTGNLFDEAAIHRIIKASYGLVVVDEAYHPFAQTSFMPQLPAYDNLLVMRTVSKMGLAGLRLGLLAGAGHWIQELDKIRLPYNINILTQKSAVFALQHSEVFEQQAAKIREQREWLLQALSGMAQLQVYPSQANFILIRLLQDDATRVFEALKARGILIKNLHPAGGPLQQCLRLTVGKPEQNQALLLALQQILQD